MVLQLVIAMVKLAPKPKEPIGSTYQSCVKIKLGKARTLVGVEVGSLVGKEEGSFDGLIEGAIDGSREGEREGAVVGSRLGIYVGLVDGAL